MGRAKARREMVKQDKPVGPGSEREQQQRKLDKNRNTQTQYNSNQKKTTNVRKVATHNRDGS